VAASPPLSPAPGPTPGNTGTGVTVMVLQSVSIAVAGDSTTIVSNVPGGLRIRQCVIGSQSGNQVHGRRSTCATLRLDSPGKFTISAGPAGTRDELMPNY
jgi:hypothetical protein